MHQNLIYIKQWPALRRRLSNQMEIPNLVKQRTALETIYFPLNVTDSYRIS